MRFYKIILIMIIQSSLVVAEETLELKEYQIELIIFKHLNIETDEVFDDNFITPAGDFLNFYEPKLQINKKSFDVKVELFYSFLRFETQKQYFDSQLIAAFSG